MHPDLYRTYKNTQETHATNILSAFTLYESGLQDSNQDDLNTATGHLQTANLHATQLQNALGQICNR